MKLKQIKKTNMEIDEFKNTITFEFANQEDMESFQEQLSLGENLFKLFMDYDDCSDLIEFQSNLAPN